MRDGFAGVVAALPEEQRRHREREFWEQLAAAHGWERVADAGCGAGFHRRILVSLGVRAVGFDLALAPLVAGRGEPLAVADVLAPALRPRSFDAVLFVGNTLSLLADRATQGQAFAALAALLRPGGMLVVQAEDAGSIVRDGAVLRTRALGDGRVHVRVFEGRGGRVRMLAGLVRPGEEAKLEGVWLLPTTAARAVALARPLGLVPVPLPLPPGGAAASWWLGLQTAGR